MQKKTSAPLLEYAHPKEVTRFGAVSVTLDYFPILHPSFSKGLHSCLSKYLCQGSQMPIYIQNLNSLTQVDNTYAHLIEKNSYQEALDQKSYTTTYNEKIVLKGKNKLQKAENYNRVIMREVIIIPNSLPDFHP